MEDFLLLLQLKKRWQKINKIIYLKLLAKLQGVFLVIFCLVFGMFLIVSTVLRSEIKSYSEKAKILTVDSSKSVNYPIIKNTSNSPSITAQAAVIIDNESKVVLYSKNANNKYPMASTTKIMTAQVALDYYKMDDVLIANNGGVEGVKVGFKNGEKVKFKDVLYGMLLPSGNDAAETIARNYPGGREAFMNKMNEKAQELHLDNTYFLDPTGLSEENTTTALDLARLASVVLRNKTFSQVVSTKEAFISDISGNSNYTILNLNKLLGVSGVNGVKTGFTDEAGQVLVTSKKEDSHLFIMVVMRSQDRFADTKALLSFISGNVNFLSIHP